MKISPQDYEHLGAFYLGRDYDTKTQSITDELTLYDSKDLVTHGVVLGMTGSGKTGLCVALLEEAALDGIPAIVIDPKGDIANMMLNFPELRAEDFQPWVHEDEARRKGVTVEELTKKKSDQWRNGLADWGQGPDRIGKLAAAVDINIFTPGSNSGMPVSILSSLAAPTAEQLDNTEVFTDRIENTVSGLLSLLGLDTDPIQSKEHILLSQIFSKSWQAGENLDLPRLIDYIQYPKMEKIGVIDLEKFYPEKDRGKLAMRVNALLASPGFSTWLEGAPLDIPAMLHTPQGKPRISIFSIAHLSDEERMFFVSLLLGQMVSWMRSQPGTTSLRTLLYMDEIFGYLPPVGSPPSKKPMMTILKQGRAFGLGALLATQNPVDLDYKALSNIGTWFIGRLQTEQDKARLLDGLEGAASQVSTGFDRSDIERIISGLDTRVFLLNNVHADAPFTFHVRWVMSFLCGPITSRQIKILMEQKKPLLIEEFSTATKTTAPSGLAPAQELKSKNNTAPHISGAIDQLYAPAKLPANHTGEIIFYPALLRTATVVFTDKKTDLDHTSNLALINPIRNDESNPIDWQDTQRYANPQLLSEKNPHTNSGFAPIPNSATDPEAYKNLANKFEDWIYENQRLQLLRSPSLEINSNPGENERDFRVRLSDAAREHRQNLIDKLREKNAASAKKLEAKLDSAEEKLDKEKDQAKAAKMSSLISVGSTLLSVFGIGGRRGGSVISRGTTAARSYSRSSREAGDVRRAEENIEEIEAEIDYLKNKLEAEIAEINRLVDPQTEQFETVEIAPYKKNISDVNAAIVWLPQHRPDSMSPPTPAW